MGVGKHRCKVQTFKRTSMGSGETVSKYVYVPTGTSPLENKKYVGYPHPLQALKPTIFGMFSTSALASW